jgi:ATP-dependent exoDNAse (exonuclease V) beta subunit
MKQMDLLERDLGDRGRKQQQTKPAALKVHKAAAAGGGGGGGGDGRVSEGVPPVAVASMEPTPAPAPAPAPVAGPPTTPPAATRSSSSGSSFAGFTPSMQQQVAVQHQQLRPSTAGPGDNDGGSLVHMLLERLLEHDKKMEAKANAQAQALENLRQETKAEKTAVEAKLKELEAKLVGAPTEAISTAQLAAVQARLEALHESELLSDDELFTMEDIAADYLEFRSSVVGGIVTIDMVRLMSEASSSSSSSSSAVAKLLKLVALSEGTSSDGGFARQVRRKFL